MKCVVRDLNDPTKLKVEEVEGFVPSNFVTFEVPADADDGELLDLETYTDRDGVERTRAVVSEARKLAKASAKEASKADQETKRAAKENRRALIKAAKGKKLKAADLPDLVALLIQEITDEE
jgi:hypothetical protein